jgi:hypothetical protein
MRVGCVGRSPLCDCQPGDIGDPYLRADMEFVTVRAVTREFAPTRGDRGRFEWLGRERVRHRGASAAAARLIRTGGAGLSSWDSVRFGLAASACWRFRLVREAERSKMFGGNPYAHGQHSRLATFPRDSGTGWLTWETPAIGVPALDPCSGLQRLIVWLASSTCRRPYGLLASSTTSMRLLGSPSGRNVAGSGRLSARALWATSGGCGPCSNRLRGPAIGSG